MSKRFTALKCLQAVLNNGQSLTNVLSKLPEKQAEKPYIKSLCYGVLRYYWQCDFIASKLLTKPLKKKDSDIHLLLLMGLFELIYSNTADHAATSETVKTCLELKKQWAKQLVNAILRKFLREKDKYLKICNGRPEALYNHPQWLMDKIQKDWPKNFVNILSANNQQAPMHLRINKQKTPPPELQANKHPIIGLTLSTPCDVNSLPGFLDGAISVQDPSAQLAATLLTPKDNETILDACAAPGGKTMHLLELAPACNVTAIDIDKQRLKKITENVNRIQATLTLRQADAADISTWWSPETPFDKILCDAPCSASGVIRRHPDIKHLRQPTDIATLATTQLHLLTQLWKTLKPGGQLLYCTCSIFNAENDAVIQAFLNTHDAAAPIQLDLKVGRQTALGWQILPGEEDMDGFYYCLLQKPSSC